MNEHLNVELFCDNKKVYLVPYMAWMLFVTFLTYSNTGLLKQLVRRYNVQFQTETINEHLNCELFWGDRKL